MIFYKAVCSRHDFESSLFKRKIDALRSARSHARRVQGSHSLKVLEVYIPKGTIEVRKEQNVED